MKRHLLLVVFCATILTMFGAMPAQATSSDQATLTVVVPERPVSAVILPGCTFAIAEGERTAECELTVLVADPTLRFAGWSVALELNGFASDCQSKLHGSQVTLRSVDGIASINEQAAVGHGGPEAAAGALGQRLSAHRAVVAALPGEGGGAYEIRMTIELRVPSNVEAGTYAPVWQLVLRTPIREPGDR